MKKVLFLTFFICFAFIQGAYACRFFVAVSEEIPPEFTYTQLVELPQSLKSLGSKYNDGWSIAIYDRGKGHVVRSSQPAHEDEDFEKAVNELLKSKPSIVMGHLRKASSGCLEGVPNPHPFKRFFQDKEWLFGHNGGMKKQILIDLIGEEFLNQHQPTTCTYDAPDSWIDSELYFIFLLKSIEENGRDVAQGIKDGLIKLYEKIEPDHRYLNFFLTDGQKVWVFRKGNTLFYQYDQDASIAFVSSTIPDAEQGQWREFPEDVLAVLEPNSKIKFIPIEK